MASPISFRFIVLIILINPTITFAQTDSDSGIRFEKNLTFSQIKEKAKTENKYIFVDCFATWCGPCKMMEQDVFPKKEVGDYFNAHFISVQVQMDRTVHDDERVKSWYRDANIIEKEYGINAYPTYLFFDPNGNAVHKALSAMSTDKFIGIGQSALDSNKQFYTVLKKYYVSIKNSESGKIDTTELKGLARVIFYADRKLAGRMAADYLNRIPKVQLALEDNLQLMIQFQDDSAVLTITRGYVKGLNQIQLGLESNLKFMKTQRLWQDSIISLTAKKYIQSLSEKERYSSKPIIAFVSWFTDTLTEPGFDIFYHHAEAVDRIMGKSHYAQDAAQGLIYNAEFNPLIESSKQSGVPPDFFAIHTRIMQKYGKTYADEVVINGKLAWYKWLVRNKKEDQYWTHFLQARVNFIQHYRMDSVTKDYNSMNAWCYDEFFLHCDDSIKLQLAVGWMKLVIDHLPQNYDVRDTYACLLYKTGRVDKAIEQEQKALSIAIDDLDKKHALITIEKMRTGEKIWLEKEYIEG